MPETENVKCRGHLAKIYLFLKNPPPDFTGCRPLAISFSLAFIEFFLTLGTILSSTFFATLYTVLPSFSSRGALSSRDRPFSAVDTFLRLMREGLFLRSSSSSSESSLDESVRNSAGRRLGAWARSARFLPPWEESVGCLGWEASFLASSSFRRSSACCLKSVSRCWRLRFCSAACLCETR